MSKGPTTVEDSDPLCPSPWSGKRGEGSVVCPGLGGRVPKCLLAPVGVGQGDGRGEK